MCIFALNFTTWEGEFIHLCVSVSVKDICGIVGAISCILERKKEISLALYACYLYKTFCWVEWMWLYQMLDKNHFEKVSNKAVKAIKTETTS